MVDVATQGGNKSMAHGFFKGANGRYVIFDPKGSQGTDPAGINSTGSITGYYFDTKDQDHGFVRTH